MKNPKKVWVVTGVFCDSGKREDPAVVAIRSKPISAREAKNLMIEYLGNGNDECAKELLEESGLKVTEAAVNKLALKLTRQEVNDFWFLEVHKTDLK